jgi:hypothetical protein
MRTVKRERTVLTLAILAVAAGVLAFAFGQALAPLLVPVCSDFSWAAPPRCRQPLLYIVGGAGAIAVGLGATTAIIWRRWRRKRSG